MNITSDQDDVWTYYVAAGGALYYTATAVIYWQHRHEELIARRFPVAGLMVLIMMIVMHPTIILHSNTINAVTRIPQLCYSYLFVIHLTVPIILSTYSLRAAHMLFMYALNQLKIGQVSTLSAKLVH